MVPPWTGIDMTRKLPANVSRLFWAAAAAVRVAVATAVCQAAARRRGTSALLRLQSGFSLMESVAAVGIIGISVVGSVLLLNLTVRTSSNTEETLALIQVLRAQAETIQNQPYNDDPSQYPLLTGIPPNITVTFTSTDPGTRYTFPEPDGSSLGQVIQQIVVTAEKDDDSASMIFYKIKTP